MAVHHDINRLGSQLQRFAPAGAHSASLCAGCSICPLSAGVGLNLLAPWEADSLEADSVFYCLLSIAACLPCWLVKLRRTESPAQPVAAAHF